jgi:hypothetical protein
MLCCIVIPLVLKWLAVRGHRGDLSPAGLPGPVLHLRPAARAAAATVLPQVNDITPHTFTHTHTHTHLLVSRGGQVQFTITLPLFIHILLIG